MKNRFAVLCLFFLMSCSSLQVNYPLCEFPKHSPFPGGVINKIVELSPSQIKAINKEKIYLCKISKNQWRILSPIKLSSEINSIISPLEEERLLTVKIASKKYRESRINIENQDLVTPPERYLERIKKESVLTREAMRVNSKIIHSSLRMTPPTLGVKSSEFGVKRFINDQPRNRHTGLDIAAPIGTEITSPLSGRVVLVGDFFYRGKTVFLDHGGGLITTYSHMNKVVVNKGQFIRKNGPIGEVGETGRVTGPHLHWQIVLFGVPVDPELFLDLNF